ncbi:hypothetical protein HAX54_044197, partial [Datura stramonium]|nr:hypothetical protein [Datura stramonium]
ALRTGHDFKCGVVIYPDKFEVEGKDKFGSKQEVGVAESSLLKELRVAYLAELQRIGNWKGLKTKLCIIETELRKEGRIVEPVLSCGMCVT